MHHNITQKRIQEKWQTNKEVLNTVLQWILESLTFIHNPNVKGGYFNILCAAGNFSRCKLVLAARLGGVPVY
jgi:hypothetical protein